MSDTIKFKDRDDLIAKLILKKSDVPEASKIIDALASSFKAFKRGDKKAMQDVIRLRKRLLNASSEVYIEMDEDGMYDAVVTQLNVLDLISDKD
jgi:hypothetical protein